MVVVIGTFRIPAERRAEARPAFARILAASRAEPGCLAYAYGEDVLEPGLFHVSEKWESLEALKAHFETPHMAAWRRERDALDMTEREVKAYAVSSEELF
jgi:quinol monooxygenase YgiN